MYLFLEAVNQFAVGIDERLLSFNLNHDLLLEFERWEGDSGLI
jgi:hypothetical protein